MQNEKFQIGIALTTVTRMLCMLIVRDWGDRRFFQILPFSRGAGENDFEMAVVTGFGFL